MREIKFRFWDREQKKYNFLSLHDLGECDEYWYDGETAVWDVLYDSTHEQKRFIVEQYTGFKDENGVEVYEGDFIQEFTGEHTQGVWEYSNVSVVEDLRWIPESLGFADCIYIIGNIYENPELLKEQTK